MDVEDADDDSSYSELESTTGTLDGDQFEFVDMIPLTSTQNPPPAPPPPRPGSPAALSGSREWWYQRRTGSSSRSTALRTGRSAIAAHAQRRTTSTTSGGSAVRSLNPSVVNNMAYRHRSPDVIPSLCEKPPAIFQDFKDGVV